MKLSSRKSSQPVGTLVASASLSLSLLILRPLAFHSNSLAFLFVRPRLCLLKFALVHFLFKRLNYTALSFS